MGMLHDIKVWH